MAKVVVGAASMRAAAKVGAGINGVKDCTISRKVGLREPYYNGSSDDDVKSSKVGRMSCGWLTAS